MSCDVTKLNYLQETKQIFRNKIDPEGKLIDDNTPFRDYEKYMGQSNLNLDFSFPSVSNLTVTNDFKVKNIAHINGVIHPNCTIDYTKPWEIKLTFAPVFSTNKTLVLCGTVGSNYLNPSCQLRLGNPDIWCGYSISGNKWDYSIAVPIDLNDIVSGETYVLILGWTGEKYHMKLLSKDGIEMYSGETAVTDEHRHVANPSGNGLFCFGNNANSSSNYFTGDFDLKSSYIKNDGLTIWGNG